MMHWDQLLSAKRFGLENRRISTSADARSQFQRDFDRVIFSSPFRRLQNKTQVFPLPGSVFVHNRLTHSMEVASVGRSIANIVGLKLLEQETIRDNELFNELGSIVSAACLCHDMGNPPFGHAGEDAISKYFEEGEGLKLKSYVTQAEWDDLLHFEGNANALRLLTHQFHGRRKGGYALTYSTLASLIKYPYSSENQAKKYGFFQTEKETFSKIAEELGLTKLNDEPVKYARHPLVYMVEAADDICYEIMDIEDAHKLKILDTGKTFELLLNFFDPVDDANILNHKNKVFQEVTDTNEQIAYLRALVINKLVNETAQNFLDNYNLIMEGNYGSTLVKDFNGKSEQAFNICKKLAKDQIYNDRSVVKIELTGFNVLGTLMEEFVYAVLNPGYNYSGKLLTLLPGQFDISTDNTYKKIRSVIDFISGMTDLYAVDLYKDIKGIRP
jgi:dGTPase